MTSLIDSNDGTTYDMIDAVLVIEAPFGELRKRLQTRGAEHDQAALDRLDALVLAANDGVSFGRRPVGGEFADAPDRDNGLVVVEQLAPGKIRRRLVFFMDKTTLQAGDAG